MNIDKTQVIEKFEKYGFNYKENASNKSYLTFTYRSGFFHNAEVVQIAKNAEDDHDIQSKIEQLQSSGVSIKRNEYKTIKQIEDGLFNGFFDTKNWLPKIRQEYKDYVDSILKILPSNTELTYKYINTPYSLQINSSDVITKNESIINEIINETSEDGAQLILIEAPAGFGKTCTSYEIINELINKKDKPIPFFTEFSRDRQARVFNHVFIREVDRAFSQVKSDVVIDELQNGRIIMVLDGFDELLSEDSSSESTEDDYDNAEPMLETISELLSGNAKVIITSRRSAIFDSATFNEWISNYIDKFKFKRYRIHSPKIEDWLSEYKRASLKNVGINIDKLSNPVLLSYLRALNIDDFDNELTKPDAIVSRYFTSMLEREMERQNLLMSPEKQTSLLTSIAEDMCDNNYTSDNKEKIIDVIKQKCSEQLEETRRSYKAKDRPTIDALATKLATHAFFDRSNQGNNKIEFINEFVFGNYIAEHIINYGEEWLASDERFVEPAISSYIARTKLEKENLWQNLTTTRDFISESDHMKFEYMMLNDLVSHRYNDSSINSVLLEDITLFNTPTIKNISFSNTSFTNIEFNVDKLINATFINCKFYSCLVHGSDILSNSFTFLNCTCNNDLLNELEESQSENENGIENELRELIFRKFFPVGSAGCERIHLPLVSIYKITNQGFSKRDITKEIKLLKKEGILTDADNSSFIAITPSCISQIKQSLL